MLFVPPGSLNCISSGLCFHLCSLGLQPYWKRGPRYPPQVSDLLGCTESSEVTWDTPDMEVKGHLISVPDLLGGSPEAVERMTELQERRRSLETLLNSRLAELRRVCLQEAELTGELPGDFPLEAGERRPNVRRRAGSYRHGPKTIIKTEEEVCQRKPKKALFSGALRRRVDSDQHPAHSKRTVHRGCHTDDTVNSESSSTSDSIGDHDIDESSGVAPDCLSPSRPRLAPGNGSSSSPDSRLCRKLSPVEIYYAMRTTTQPNSLALSARSNMEGRSVPTTPLLARNGPTGVHNHIRSAISTVTTNKQWSDNPEVTQVVPHQSQVSGHSPGPSSGPPSGSYEQGGGGGGGVYSDILMDYVWGKQQQQQRQAQQVHGNGQFPSSVPVPPPSHFNGYPHPQGHLPGPQHVSGGPPAYSSPLMLRGKLGEPRRVKVTRTKSCGPFIPLQHHQNEVLHFSSYTSSSSDPPLPPTSSSSSTGTSTAALYPHQGSGVESQKHQHGSGSGPGLNLNHNHQLGPPQYSDSVTPDDPIRSLHKALALEGLRDWYLRNSLGGVAVGGKVPGQDNRGSPRRRTTNSLHGSHPQHLPHQPQIYQGDRDRDYPPCHLPQSQTFHGHPLHGRSLYQGSFPSQMQELTLKEPSTDRGDLPTPGTLV
uniref:coiled-coil domain-containing protein 120 n=1 Tax=Oncorhynchus gorbuscha TaxID=8017 RepID=UPI001EAF2A0A|nr:coiled-coil domain-containing protein 120 [Oncorhynchus gorbuscha]